MVIPSVMSFTNATHPTTKQEWGGEVKEPITIHLDIISLIFTLLLLVIAPWQFFHNVNTFFVVSLIKRQVSEPKVDTLFCIIYLTTKKNSKVQALIQYFKCHRVQFYKFIERQTKTILNRICTDYNGQDGITQYFVPDKNNKYWYKLQPNTLKRKKCIFLFHYVFLFYRK